MKKHSLFKRILSGILAALTVVSLIPVQASSAGTGEVDEVVQTTALTEGFKITVDGEEKTTLTLRSHEKIKICADGLTDAAQYQWQIQHPEKPGTWINIYDATKSSLNVTLALVKNMLTHSCTTQLRCRAIVNGEPQFTPAMTVIHDDTVASAPVAIPEEKTEPTEAAIPDQTVETTVPETVAPTVPEETTIPTEVTEPVVATVPTEPVQTVEPTVAETAAPTVPEETTVSAEVTEPVMTTVPTEPAQTVEPTVAETAAPTVPEETTLPTEVAEPVMTIAATEPEQTMPETVPVTEPAEPTEHVGIVEDVSQANAVSAVAVETVPPVTEETIPTEPAGEPETFDTLAVQLTGNQTLVKAANEEPTEFVTVQIDYVRYDFARNAEGKLIPDGHGGYQLDEDGQVAFTSYVATLQYGTPLHTIVPVPTMVGYDTYLNDIPVENVPIDEDSITENITYTVAYKPALVNYTIRYYFQNIYDDLYVEDTGAKVTAQGFTGAVPADDLLKKEFDGFLSLYYQPDSIAADGSTVFEVYYERNYYLMEFDCNGGYGTDTLYNRYGSYISVPNPVMPGYVFGGWDFVTGKNEEGKPIGDGHKDELPTTMPAENRSYVAIWNTAETTYTVAYWVQENGTNTYIGSSTVAAESGKPVYGGNDLANANLCGLDTHAHTAACYQCGSIDHEHTEACYRCGLATHAEKIDEIALTCTHIHSGDCCPGYEKRSPSNNDLTAFHAIGSGEPQSGYVYTINATNDNNTYYYLYVDGVWYYLINNNRWISGGVLRTSEVTLGGRKFTARKYNTKLACGHVHNGNCTHQPSCYGCGTDVHVHSAACKNEWVPYLEYVGCDNAVIVEGDGSAVMNVYYKYKEYTIRYVYARRINANNDQYNYQIATLTRNGVLSECQWTTVGNNENVLPSFDDPSGKTVRSYFDDGNVRYYYISLSAVFGDNISEDWPSAAIGNVTASSDTVYSWGSWAAEYGTGYRENYGNEHANIVGPYPVMSAEMIKENPKSLDDGTYLAQNMIAWWGNSDQHISAHAYHNYFEVISAPKTDEEITETPVKIDGKYYRKYNGKIYQLSTDVFTAAHNGTTRVDPVVFDGFTVINENKETQGSSNNAAYTHNGTCAICTEEKAKLVAEGKLQETDNLNYHTDFFYDRIHYKLNFMNHGANLTHGNGSDVPYGMNLRLHGEYVSVDKMNNAGIIDPDTNQPFDPYPSTLEPNAYEFTGWYTTDNFLDGTRIDDWSAMTMPASDMVVYARWEPIKRNVTFYTFYDDIELKEGDEDYDAALMPFLDAPDMPHGTILGSAYNKNPAEETLPDGSLKDPRVKDYTFIGWFYMDEDNKKRFAPDTMEINRDLVLFAEWKTEIDTTYEVHYVLRDDVSAANTTDGKAYKAGDSVADSIYAHASVGKTKTFNAKALGELYPSFRVKFFPTSNSHSILMTEDETKNVYTFTYIYDAKVFYKVRYLEAGTGRVLAETVVRGTEDAVVTEKFLPISGYIPQNYYIRKTLSADGTDNDSLGDDNLPSEDSIHVDNVITFYYVKDEDHGVYSIEYYLENVDSTDANDWNNYTQYESIVGTADLGKTITADLRSYEGYTHLPEGDTVITYQENGEIDQVTKGVVSGIVTDNGLTIKLYYKRNTYPYIIEYREYGAEETLKVISEGCEGKFDQEVTHTAPEIYMVEEQKEVNGETITVTHPYTYYIKDATSKDLTKTITIRSFVEGEENPNKMIFYYLPKEVDVHYDVVYRNSAVTGLCRVSLESEKAATAENISGASAMPAEGFRFVGWYLDKECEQRVNHEWVSLDGEYQKLKPEELDTTKDEVHYYALFEPLDLKVTYEANGGIAVPEQTAHIGETVTLPTTTRTGYTLTGWWYDANEDHKVDEGEEYAPGAAFTMPGKDVLFTAQWIDERFDNKRGVFVGLNMSFYKDGDSNYYKFPPGEPTIVNLEAARAYILSMDDDGKNIWAVQENDWNKALGKPGELSKPAEPKDYIDPAIMDQVTQNGDVIGLYDETGKTTRKLLYFTEDDYKGIVQAWLNAREYFKSHFAHYNINWDLLPLDADLYEAVPYVIKRHHHDLTGRKDWFIDFVVLPKARFEVKYVLNLPEGFTDTAPEDDNLYGQGMYVNVMDFHDVPSTADSRYVAKFVGWTATDASGKPVVIDSATKKFTMPDSNVTLTAQWEFCAPLTISQTGLEENESAIYHIVGDGVDLTVAITGTNQLTIQEIPLGEYTVTEITGWSWKHNGDDDPKVTITEPEVQGQDPDKVTLDRTGPDSKVEFYFAYKKSDWLHGESNRDNRFS